MQEHGELVNRVVASRGDATPRDHDAQDSHPIFGGMELLLIMRYATLVECSSRSVDSGGPLGTTATTCIHQWRATGDTCSNPLRGLDLGWEQFGVQALDP